VAGSGGAGPAGFGCDRWIREEKSAFALETEEEHTDGNKEGLFRTNVFFITTQNLRMS
jgi:hypothetical protein